MGETQKGGYRLALDDLGTLRVYVAVVETGSFTLAGERLGIVPSTVSKQMAALESRLSAQLIIRSTKGVSITELGMEFYDRCLMILDVVREVESGVIESQGECQGTLRVSCTPVLIETNFVPILNRFLQNNPKVSIDLEVTSHATDLVSSGLDIAITLKNDLNPNHIALKLAENDRIYCAAPQYLEEHGTPQVIEDLRMHNCLVINNPAFDHSADWSVPRPHGSGQPVTVSGHLRVNTAEVVVKALLEKMGVGHLARVIVDDYLKSGELVELFPGTRVQVSEVYAVYPRRRYLPLKTRAFIDHLKAEFKGPPWTDR